MSILAEDHISSMTSDPCDLVSCYQSHQPTYVVPVCRCYATFNAIAGSLPTKHHWQWLEEQFRSELVTDTVNATSLHGSMFFSIAVRKHSTEQEEASPRQLIVMKLLFNVELVNLQSQSLITFHSDSVTGIPHCTNIHKAASSSYAFPMAE